MNNVNAMNMYGKSSSKDNHQHRPFANVGDPMCEIILRESSEFVKSSFPTSNERVLAEQRGKRREGSNYSAPQQRRRAVEASTPARSPVPNKSLPSKWDDAERWVMNGHCHNYKQMQLEAFSENPRQRVLSESVPNFDASASLEDHPNWSIQASLASSKEEKFTDSTEFLYPRFRFKLEPMKNACTDVVPTPVGSYKTSPPRHNTPASFSGPLAKYNNTSCTIDAIQLEECHFSKLQLGTQYDSVAAHWGSREEEEEEVSRSLRHNASQNADWNYSAITWEGEKAKCCLRYQREEAKIQAWVNLQKARKEAELRKLEVKIEKMRSNLEEKMMKKMEVVQRKAEDWKEEAKQQHLENIRKAYQHELKIMNQHNKSLVSGHNACGCFPCNLNHL